jgi:hypothetical protein
MAWTQDDVDFFNRYLSVSVPHARIKLDTLGSVERASISILLCFDKRETWVNNIMENSRYMWIMIESNGKVEHFSGSCGLKMRAFTSTDRNKIMAKILAHIVKVLAQIEKEKAGV